MASRHLPRAGALGALLGLATALAIAILVYGMPAKLALAAAADGAAFGLLPIGWIIVGAIFVYDVTVKSGDFARGTGRAPKILQYITLRNLPREALSAALGP